MNRGHVDRFVRAQARRRAARTPSRWAPDHHPRLAAFRADRWPRLLLPGIAALLAAQYLHSLALLLAASGVVGVASGLGYRCGLEVVSQIAPEDERAQLVSSYLVVCYAAISLPVIGVRLVSPLVGSMIADAAFGALNVLLATAALIFEISRKKDVAQHRSRAA